MQIPAHIQPSAVAFTFPFHGDGTAITVMSDRLLFLTAQRPKLRTVLLAHVLAHEIAHILQITNAHSETGVMKQHWTGEDYDKMEKRPLEFTRTDVELIQEGFRARLQNGQALTRRLRQSR
jgi:hypothetical protein